MPDIMEPVVLEEWLRSSVSSSFSGNASTSESAPGFAAKEIVQAWAQIRTCVLQKVLTSADSAAFDLLIRHRRSLHLAESQAKLLIALLTDVRSNDPALLVSVRRFAILGLLAWIRKDFARTGSNVTSMKQDPETFALVVHSLGKAMEERPLADGYTSAGILLLGTISSLQVVSPAVKRMCLAKIAVELRERKDVIVRGEIAEALAGAGYALAASQEDPLPVFWALLFLWTPVPTETPSDKTVSAGQRVGVELDSEQTRGVDGPILKDVLMLLHLMDYLGSTFISRGSLRTASNCVVELMHDALRSAVDDSHYNTEPVHSAIVMASVGLLRSLYRWGQGNKKHDSSVSVDHKSLAIMASLENVVVKISEQATPSYGSISTLRASGSFHGDVSQHAQTRKMSRCVGVAVSRCSGLPAHPCIVRCLLFCIFDDALYLDSIYSTLIPEELVNERSGISRPRSTSTEEKLVKEKITLDNFRLHVESFFFRETGAIARAMCDQYMRSTRDLQRQTENLISGRAQNVYKKHRVLVATSEVPLRQRWPQYGQTLEKVLEAYFLTLVVFFSIAVREHMSDDEDGSEAELAPLALDSLSCVEYFRHVPLREFSKIIQRCVIQISGSEASALALAHSLPAYEDIIQRPGTPDLNFTYSWDQDEVQTARVLFYFKILPMCLSKMPEAAFATEVAPLMFLYMGHHSDTVAKASHALFVSFLSLGGRTGSTLKLNEKKSTSQGPQTKSSMSLREQLVVFYIQRALQVFPGVTPFQGLVAGVGAIARHLPSGSPVTVYCLSCLVDKAITLQTRDLHSKEPPKIQSGASPKDSLGGSYNQHPKLPVEEIGSAQKLQLLLLHLILLVDLQVLPMLLKLMAKLILGLPQHLRIGALAEAFDVLGGSDDYTRKPIIVSWLQSLSFLILHMKDQPKNTESISEDDHSTGTARPLSTSTSLIDSTNESKSLSETKNSVSSSGGRSSIDAVQETSGDDMQGRNGSEVAEEEIQIPEPRYSDASQAGVKDLGDTCLDTSESRSRL